MPFRTSHIGRIRLAWLVIAALIMQSLVPLGYMPVAASQTGGFFSVAICGGKTTHAPVKKSDAPAKHNSFCSFSIGKSFSLEGIKPPALTLFIFGFVTVIALLSLNFKRQYHFGNASPRAPPVLS